MQTWANNNLGEHPFEMLDTFLSGLTVNLIATGRGSLVTCSPDEELRAVTERNRDTGFDFLPVAASKMAKNDAPIIGLIEIARFMQGQRPLGRVQNQMRPLSEENLLGADASILRFVRDADRQQCRLIISGPEISGLVSISDLQRLPARAALFAMVTHLEIIMAENIRREFESSDDWFQRLSTDRQIKVRQKVGDAKSRDAFVDMLLYTEFVDKVTIIRKSPKFSCNKKEFDSDLFRVQTLRNSLAHANNYAANRDDAFLICDTVRRMDYWSKILAGMSP